ncbi:MAG: four helix bundle protein [Candidatus Omnitrophica bacterium]|nr:four helix bundle protein [Candidatus Omnitrophota bacterium]
MAEKIRNFRDLNIWKKGMEIVEQIYQTTQKFPSCELYGLTTQMRRAAVSIPSNIAEGFARKHGERSCLLEKIDHVNRMTMNLIKCL